MPIYENSDQLYACFQELIERVAVTHPQATESMLKSGLRFRFSCSDPAAELTIDARQRPLQVLYGPTAEKPDLDVQLTADTLHRILLGELSLSKAVGSRQVVPKGPVWKTMALADLFTQARAVYPQIVRERM